MLVLGIAYKRNVDDMRESSAVELMKLFQEKGAIIEYSDPHVPKFPKMRKHHLKLDSVKITPEKLKEFDLALIATDYDAFDNELIKRNAILIVDTRCVYTSRDQHIVKA